VPQTKLNEEKEDRGLEEEVSRQSIDENVVPELEDSPPPSINVLLPSPIRSGFKIKSEVSSVGSLDESQGLSQEAPEEADINQRAAVEETDMRHDFDDDSLNEFKSKVTVKQEQGEPMEVEINTLSAVKKGPPQEELDVADIKYNVEEMTVIDEVMEDGGQEERTETADRNEVRGESVAGESGDGVSRELCSSSFLRSFDKEL
jgi:hypothetical protein